MTLKRPIMNSLTFYVVEAKGVKIIKLLSSLSWLSLLILHYWAR
jgi:hypothetical protein